MLIYKNKKVKYEKNIIIIKIKVFQVIQSIQSKNVFLHFFSSK